MKSRAGIFGFLGFYLLILFVSFGGNLLFFQKAGSDVPLTQLWMYSLSQITLTHAKTGFVFNDQPFSFHLFFTIITFVSSWVFHSIALWLCWRLFGSTREKSYPVRVSILTMTIVIFICLLLLSVFFLYAIPIELTKGSYSQKTLAALSLSVNSFNNAGFSNWYYFFSNDLLARNFMIQIGVIGGTVLGSMGIFVINELFSPGKLRQRLADPAIDWSYITRISIFGSAVALISYVAIYSLLGDSKLLAGKNILESLSFILMKGISARGFGYDIAEQPGNTMDMVNVAMTFFGAGPFSTGGGATLLFFFFLYHMIFKKNHSSIHVKISYKIIRAWLTISIIFFSCAFIIMLIGQSNITLIDLFYLYTNHHIKFTSDENMLSSFIKTITMIAGRFSFITACIIVISQNRHASGIF